MSYVAGSKAREYRGLARHWFVQRRAPYIKTARLLKMCGCVRAGSLNQAVTVAAAPLVRHALCSSRARFFVCCASRLLTCLIPAAWLRLLLRGIWDRSVPLYRSHRLHPLIRRQRVLAHAANCCSGNNDRKCTCQRTCPARLFCTSSFVNLTPSSTSPRTSCQKARCGSSASPSPTSRPSTFTAYATPPPTYRQTPREKTRMKIHAARPTGTQLPVLHNSCVRSAVLDNESLNQ